MKRQFEQEYDRIASSRLSRLDGGISKRIALMNKRSMIFEFKMRRLGLSGSHIDACQKIIDDISINETLSNHTIGVRFATIPRSKKPLDIWKIKD
jgi:hypothetical protein